MSRAIRNAILNAFDTDGTVFLCHDSVIFYKMEGVMTKSSRLTPLLVGTVLDPRVSMHSMP